MSDWHDRAVMFDCAGESLVGIVSAPLAPAEVGVLVVVGGPQYRAGSHRQFVLLARYLAARGIPCMRFDYRGMGDATGPASSFEAVSDDIDAAIGAFLKVQPGLRQVVLWGLCDGASAVCLYPAATDRRVAGAVLLNPWVHTEAGEAKVFLKHYYLQRLTDPAFWKKLLGGQVSVLRSVGSLVSLLKAAGGRSKPSVPVAVASVEDVGSLPERMAKGLLRRVEPLAVFLSGRDYVAREFEQVQASSPDWRSVLGRKGVDVQHFPDADHTFSGLGESDAVAEATFRWLLANGFARA
jgi:exosortase A-associated hydrolase 1